MRKFLGIVVITVLAFGYTWGAIYYDPDTNSYVTTDPNEETQDQDTQDEETQDQDDEQEGTGDLADDQDQEENDETGSVDIPDEDTTYDGPLADLHEQLDEHTHNLLDQLDGYHEDLSEQAKAIESGSGGMIRYDVLRCLGLIETEMNFSEQLDTVHQQLRRQIGIKQKDIHSDITALEGKIEDDLLDSLDQKLETSSVTNKVESFNTEFTDVIDTFEELFSEYINDADQLAEEASEEHAEMLRGYDERVEAYRELEAAYDEFVKKSSFAGVVAGPNIQSLYELKDHLYGYYNSQLWSTWHEEAVEFTPRFPTERAVLAGQEADLQSDFEVRFNEYADELLEGLYPVEDLLLLHKSVLSLRSAYTDNSGALDCKAFANNRTIEVSGPELQEYMDEVLNNLNKYANQIAESELPTDKEALKEGLAAGLSDQTNTIIDELVTSHKDELEQQFSSQGLTLYSAPRPSQGDDEEQLVRQFLQEMFRRYREEGQLEAFYEKLATANEKIDTALSEDLPGRTEERLQMIQKVVLEFIS